METAYLDNSATTPLSPSVIAAMTDVLQNHFGNPSSLYRLGIHAEKLISSARQSVSELLGCRSDEFYFTGSGTESDNIALFGTVLTKKNAGSKIVSTAIEHPAVENALKLLEKQGFQVSLVEPRSGIIHSEDILNAITKDTILVSCMHVNNETGEILPLEGIKERMKEIGSRGFFHTDAVQSFGKLPGVLDFSPDLISISAHKIHGPKGVGGLYIKKGIQFVSPVSGGGQEKNIRSGTENTAGIVGFGKACELKIESIKADFRNVAGLCRQLEEELSKLPFEVVLNKPEKHLPYVLNFSVPALKSEVLLHFLESEGIYVSSGSACSSKSRRSKVLTAMNLPDYLSDSAIRVSFSGYNTKEHVAQLIDGLKKGYNSLAHI